MMLWINVAMSQVHLYIALVLLLWQQVLISSGNNSIINNEYFLHNTSTGTKHIEDQSTDVAAGWQVGNWSVCSTSCGTGIQSRTVICPVHIHCNQPKPATTQHCNVEELCPQWQPSAWNQCNTSCGEGFQERQLTCVVQRGSRKETVPESRCDLLTKPATSQMCYSGPCHGLEWITSEWSDCLQQQCEEESFETRLVLCCNQNGEIFPDVLCDVHRKPLTSRACDKTNRCQKLPRWHTSQWGPCSMKCGHGVQYRKVFCAISNDNSITVQPHSDCDQSVHMPDKQDCVGTECSPIWFTGEYSKCSRTCGEGQRSRIVICLKADSLQTIDDKDCDTASRPTGNDICNIESCKAASVREPSECKESKFGCCPDGFAAAQGPNNDGCLHHDPQLPGTDCILTEFGCCPDGITIQTGPDGFGCATLEKEEVGSGDEEGVFCSGLECGYPLEGCSVALYGCCPDGTSVASGPDFEGCPESNKTIMCSDTVFGCCLDGISLAVGPNYAGCPSRITPLPPPAACVDSEFGCCPDGKTYAQGHGSEGCMSVTCDMSQYGCCLDGSSSAQGPNFEGCSTAHYEQTCHDSLYGCCGDNVSVAHGPHQVGCLERIRLGALCTMPEETGPCGDYSIKWFFDSTLGSCTRAWYSGCDINAHRFDSEETCNNVCVNPSGYDVCFLPASVGRCRASVQKYFYNATSQKCQQFIYGGCDGNANNFDSIQLCEQRCQQPLSPGICNQPPQSGPCHGRFDRFYYDAGLDKCLSFVYGGCHGNDNRFDTTEACESHCRQPTSSGRKLPADKCSQEQDPGPCYEYVIRYYYDGSVGDCQPFYYGGCEGNENNFESADECHKQCLRTTPPNLVTEPSAVTLPTLITDMCSQERDPGPCYEYVIRYYYDGSVGDCQPFYYGGCEGNENNFESADECLKQCRRDTSSNISTVQENECLLAVDIGPCRRSLPRWYYDSTHRRCFQFSYGGCQGNHNRFMTEDQCIHQCGNLVRRTADDVTTVNQISPDICKLHADYGQCNSAQSLWHYDASSQTCQQFVYSGCGGNNNRFETQELCEAKCQYSGREVPPGEEPENNVFREFEIEEETTTVRCVDRLGVLVLEGQTYKPQLDPCIVCTCQSGQPVHCMTSHCQPPDCLWQQIEDQCCQFQCLDNDTSHQPQQLNVRIESERESVRVGEDIRLFCRVDNITVNSEVTFEWMRHGQLISSSEGSRYHQTGAQLIIEKVSEVDATDYVCVMRQGYNMASSQSWTLHVNLLRVPENCADKPWYANCELIVEGQLCRHPYFSIFCCKSCYEAGQLP